MLNPWDQLALKTKVLILIISVILSDYNTIFFILNVSWRSWNIFIEKYWTDQELMLWYYFQVVLNYLKWYLQRTFDVTSITLIYHLRVYFSVTSVPRWDGDPELTGTGMKRGGTPYCLLNWLFYIFTITISTRERPIVRSHSDNRLNAV